MDMPAFWIFCLVYLSHLVTGYSEIVESVKEGIAIRVDGGHTEVRQYTNFTLICETTSDIGRIKWFLNGRRMAVSLRRKPNSCSLIRSARKRGEYATMCKGKQIQLVVEEVTDQDSGRWACEDPNVDLKSNEVEVKVIPDTTESTPSNLPESIRLTGNTVMIVYGVDPVLLTCKCQCDDIYVFAWDYGNVTANVSAVKRTSNTCLQQLTAWVSWRDDGSTIKCIVTNPTTQKTASANITLDLQYMPQNPVISISPRDNIIEGQEVNISCQPNPEGKPRGRTTVVVRPGNDNSRTRQYYVTFQVSRDDDGAEINCYALNKYTSGNSSAYSDKGYLNVLYSPKLTVTSNVSISEDGIQSVVFTCTASGNPDNTTFLPWTHMYGNTVVRALAGTNNSTHSVLRMSSLRYQDTGIYICNGTNGIGRNGSMYSFHWAMLDVQGPPYFPDYTDEATVVKTQQNTSFTLTFRYVSDPGSNVTWIAKGKQLSPNETGPFVGSSPEKISVDMYGKSIRLSGHEERLLFPSVSANDDGDYFIRVCNEYGCRDSNVIQLKATDSPPTGVILEGQEESSVNMALIIGISAGAAILVIVLVLVILLVLQRRKCGTHDTTSDRTLHNTNGLSVTKGNAAYDRDSLGATEREHKRNGTDKDSILVIIKSSLYGKSVAADQSEGHGAEPAASAAVSPGVYMEVQHPDQGGSKEAEAEAEDEAKAHHEETQEEADAETEKIVTEIYSQVQKPRSSQKGSTVSDDVPIEVIGDPPPEDAFRDVGSRDDCDRENEEELRI
ncbi:kin of IRRE-like protein 3 isoform X2 [Haliotis asinina]|uniref:kin of IRRE-like protein 3 isoform X2 n=1 Tax=Haliotis asinina TaxID=109174 RepID=UPI003531BB35